MYIGDVECDTYEEYLEKREILWDESDYNFPNYDLGEVYIDDYIKEEDMKYYKESMK